MSKIPSNKLLSSNSTIYYDLSPKLYKFHSYFENWNNTSDSNLRWAGWDFNGAFKFQHKLCYHEL